MSKSEDVRAVAPALENYAQKVVLGDLWKRPGLSPRDRSIVTVSALIARDQTVELLHYLGLALDNGVKPTEISEIITHLAFYTGWANAMDAIPAARDVFKSRNIGLDQLPPASGPQLPLDEASEKQRATRVGEQFGQVTPSLVQYTTDVLFRDLWLRATNSIGGDHKEQVGSYTELRTSRGAADGDRLHHWQHGRARPRGGAVAS